MLNQWDCLLKNLGAWHGSFTRYSPEGREIEDIPTLVSLEARNNGKSIHQIVRRFPPAEEPNDLVLDYSELNDSILFFPDGTFSQGAKQWGRYFNFGGEFGLINGDRRLRLVQLYNQTGKFDRFVLIREKLNQPPTNYQPDLSIEQLIGEWQGTVTTISRDFQLTSLESYLKITQAGDNLMQQLTFGHSNNLKQISSTAKIKGNQLLFEQGDLPVQILLLPDGASCNCPLEIRYGFPFVLEMGWLISPTQRQRIIRSFNAKGEWLNCTLVKETKVI
ncbi:MAG: DUF3598 family protein [Cyanobacteria bacterium J083]|nr:MAG: DUF3598 family protein [Cyanobacteria bacterium J083]